jgi:hypothetical protein
MDNKSTGVPKMLLTILPKCQIIDVREGADGLQIRKFDWKDLANVISGKAVAWVSDCKEGECSDSWVRKWLFTFSTEVSSSVLHCMVVLSHTSSA